MATQFERNFAHQTLPGLMNVEFDVNEDSGVCCFLTLTDDDGEIVGEYATDDKAEIEDFFSAIERLQARYEVLREVDSQTRR